MRNTHRLIANNISEASEQAIYDRLDIIGNREREVRDAYEQLKRLHPTMKREYIITGIICLKAKVSRATVYKIISQGKALTGEGGGK